MQGGGFEVPLGLFCFLCDVWCRSYWETCVGNVVLKCQREAVVLEAPSASCYIAATRNHSGTRDRYWLCGTGCRLALKLQLGSTRHRTLDFFLHFVRRRVVFELQQLCYCHQLQSSYCPDGLLMVWRSLFSLEKAWPIKVATAVKQEVTGRNI